MSLWPLVLSAALSGVTAGGAPVAPLPGYAIQPAGSFHAGEPVARDGEAWLGLLTHGDDSALVATRVRLRAVHDAVVDAPGQATGVEVASTLGEEARYFLRGPNLVAGAVESTGFTPVARDATAPHHVFRFHGQDYRHPMPPSAGRRGRRTGAVRLRADAPRRRPEPAVVRHRRLRRARRRPRAARR